MAAERRKNTITTGEECRGQNKVCVSNYPDWRRHESRSRRADPHLIPFPRSSHHFQSTHDDIIRAAS